MSKYLYIVAYNKNGYTAFSHIFLDANDKDDAYTEGMETLDPIILNKYGNNCLINNYVVRIDEQISNADNL